MPCRWPEARGTARALARRSFCSASKTVCQPLAVAAEAGRAATASGWHTVFEAEQNELRTRVFTLPSSSGRRRGPARPSSSRTVQA